MSTVCKDNLVSTLIENAKVAQEKIENYTQEQVDQIAKEVAKVVCENAEELARMAVDETGMGIYEDKVAKNRGKSLAIWNDLRDKKSVGIIDRDEETGIVKVAKPIGVVAAVTPTTNPIVTPMCNISCAIKGRNAIIIAPHPRSKKCSSYTVELINKAIAKYNVPENLIQVIEEPTLERSTELMESADVVIATGGAGMVKAAYSSGKPSYGVGPGNVQVIVDKGVDYKEAAEKIIVGRTFDNGIICSGEQSVIAPREDYDEVMKAFKSQGAYLVTNAEDKEKIRKTIFVDGTINRDAVGQSVAKIAELAGLDIPEETRVILVEADGIGAAEELCREKMCPVMVTIKYDTFEDALNIAQTNLNFEGKGHTAVIHSNDQDKIDKAGDFITVSRLVVNQSSSTNAGGSFYNGFSPTTTLGCGTWGNNSISENLTYYHLINISKIGNLRKNVVIPTPEELFN